LLIYDYRDKVVGVFVRFRAPLHYRRTHLSKSLRLLIDGWMQVELVFISATEIERSI
jgi:hypothetical protein